MAFLNFLFQPKNELEPGGRSAAPAADADDPVRTCPNCHLDTPVSVLKENCYTCSCGHHFRIRARTRIDLIADPGSFAELFTEVDSSDPISFPGYSEKLASAKSRSQETEAVVCGTAAVGGRRCCLFVMEPNFMMGSMGTAVGERITALFEYALEHSLPVVGFTVSGGARMQEGLFSLMQMAKTSGAVRKHSDAGLLYIVVLTNPTTGGVTASFAMEADIILAEPGATVGFAGARVIEQTTLRPLPKGFQTSEFILQHGFADAIVSRPDQKEVLVSLLGMHEGGLKT